MTVSTWNGHFINLERSADRRTLIEAALAKAGLRERYQRFPAVDGFSTNFPKPLNLVPGAWGCLLSHAALVSLPHPRDRFLHILEDDAMLSRFFRPAMEQMVANEAMRPFDLIFTDIAPFPNDTSVIKTLNAAYIAATESAEPRFGLLDLKSIPFVGTTSYFISAGSLDKVKTALRALPPMPADVLYLKAIQEGHLRAACIFPFITAPDPKLASVINGGPTVIAAAFDAVRHAFYADASIDSVMSLFGVRPKHVTGDARNDLFREIQRMVVEQNVVPAAGLEPATP